MRNRLKPLLLFTLWTLCLAAMEVQAGLTARLDSDRIAEGETVRLLVEADGQVSGRPDTSPLAKDFDILGVASSSRVNIINGRMDARTTWTITLAPKRSGKLTIPPLELDGEQSPSLTLQVSEAPVAAGPSAGNSIFIETEVDRSDPYVQGMVRYTVRLFHGVKLAKGSLSEPRPDNALVRRLGEDREYTAERGGRRYRVIERQYAVFPQASGELVLPAPVLDARVPEKSSRRRSPFQDFFGRKPFDDPFFGGTPLGDMFAATRPVRVRGEAQILNVRSRPDQASGFQWLPAESVVLIESWQPEDGEVRVGDPLTRTVTIRARGVTGEQLPDLDPGSVGGFKVYPDRAKTNTRDLNQGVEGEKGRSIAFVPIRPGRFTLPGVRLHWWDTQADQERVAELPERTVEVLPAADAQGAPAQPSAAPQTAPDITPSISSIETEDSSEEANVLPAGMDKAKADVQPTHAGMWPWISIFFALLWLVTLGIWWRGKRYPPGSVERAARDETAQGGAGKAKKRFLSACHANDPHLTRRSLLEWAAAHWPDDPPTGLDDLAQRLDDPQAGEALAGLDQTLYRGEEQAWDGSALADAVTKLPGRGSEKDEKTPLPDLYT